MYKKTRWVNLLSSTMLFRSCAIFSSATFGGVELVFAIGSYKQKKHIEKGINEKKINKIAVTKKKAFANRK